jgi:1-acyl-sn-glycerol-3-phosphate acyltransferase
MSAEVRIDHQGSPVETTTWRTLLVFAHTFSASTRVAGRAAVGRLRPVNVDRVLDRWCDHVFGISKTTLRVEGAEHARGGPYVLLSNHQSLLDVPSVVASFPGRVSFVAKQELRRVPMFGRAMEAAGIVFVDRGDRAKAITQLTAARERLAEGTSVWIAAEGTRSKDGALGPFKKGGFHVAVGLEVPILPTWVEGTLGVIPPGSLRSVTGQTVTVRFGPPIPTTRRSVESLLPEVRAALLALSQGGGNPG